MFLIDIETLDTESTTIVLSTAILYFDTENKSTFEEYVNKTCFVKFDVKEQKTMGRSVSADTVDWWKKQSKEVQQISLLPSENDVSVEMGIKKLQQYIRDNSKEKEELVWIRGTIDQMAMDSLCKSVKMEKLFPYWAYRDVRTFIDFTKETAKKGYCKIPNFDFSKVKKHDPIHDVCLDTLMILEGE